MTSISAHSSPRPAAAAALPRAPAPRAAPDVATVDRPVGAPPVPTERDAKQQFQQLINEGGARLSQTVSATQGRINKLMHTLLGAPTVWRDVLEPFSFNGKLPQREGALQRLGNVVKGRREQVDNQLAVERYVTAVSTLAWAAWMTSRAGTANPAGAIDMLDCVLDIVRVTREGTLQHNAGYQRLKLGRLQGKLGAQVAMQRDKLASARPAARRLPGGDAGTIVAPPQPPETDLPPVTEPPLEPPPVPPLDPPSPGDDDALLPPDVPELPPDGDQVAPAPVVEPRA